MLVRSLLQKNHEKSNRRGKKFFSVNCAAIPHTLAESELFGYVGGSFTGSRVTDRKGYFELANVGTLFLDEVGSTPYDIQGKLLRAVENGTFIKIGGEREENVNVRIISTDSEKKCL